MQETLARQLSFKLRIFALSISLLQQNYVCSPAQTSGHYASSGFAKYCFYPQTDPKGKMCSCNESNPKCQCEVTEGPGSLCPGDHPNCQCCIALTCHHEEANPAWNKLGPIGHPPWFPKPFPNMFPPRQDFSEFMRNVGGFQAANLTQHAHHSSSLMTSTSCSSTLSPNDGPCQCQHMAQCQCQARVHCSPFGNCQCCLHKKCHAFQGFNEPVPNWFPTTFFDNAGFPFSSDNFFGNEWDNFFV